MILDIRRAERNETMEEKVEDEGQRDPKSSCM